MKKVIEQASKLNSEVGDNNNEEDRVGGLIGTPDLIVFTFK